MKRILAITAAAVVVALGPFAASKAYVHHSHTSQAKAYTAGQTDGAESLCVELGGTWHGWCKISGTFKN